jgi:hypothetical protein
LVGVNLAGVSLVLLPASLKLRNRVKCGVRFDVSDAFCFGRRPFRRGFLALLSCHILSEVTYVGSRFNSSHDSKYVVGWKLSLVNCQRICERKLNLGFVIAVFDKMDDEKGLAERNEEVSCRHLSWDHNQSKFRSFTLFSKTCRFEPPSIVRVSKVCVV